MLNNFFIICSLLLMLLPVVVEANANQQHFRRTAEIQWALKSQNRTYLQLTPQEENDLSADHRTIFEISQSEEDQLLHIAESGTKTSYKAQAILYAARGTDFPVVLPALASGGDNWYSSFKSVNSKISPLYPNPSNYTATISYELQTGEEGVFSFYSPLGHILETAVFTQSGNYLLDVHKYTAGLYFYTVSINGKPVVNNKFVVIK